MKRFYYMTRSLSSVLGIHQDLEAGGIGHNRLHVMGKHNTVLHQAKVHTTTPWEETDIMHSGFVGAVGGLVTGLLLGLILVAMQPFGIVLGSVTVMASTAFFLSLGAWFGGLIGISRRNHHLQKFLPDVARGEYLVMVDVDDNDQERRVRRIMGERHREARVAGEEDGYSPFF